MFFEKHLTFSKIPRDDFEKTTVCFLTYFDMFFEHSKGHFPRIYYSWFDIPIMMILEAYLIKWKETVSLKKKCIWIGFQWVTMGFITYEGLVHRGRLDTIDYLEQDYYIRNGKRNKIATFNQTTLYKRRMRGLDLVLAHKGMLYEIV